MAMAWQSHSMVVWMQDHHRSGWHSFSIYGSIVQGNLEGQPCFCIAIAVVLHMVVADPRLSQWRSRIKHWIYVDDWTIQVPLAAACTLMTVISGHLRQQHLQLKESKCAFQIPCLQHTAEDEWPLDVLQLAGIMPQRQEGLVLLGTVAAGETFNTTLRAIRCRYVARSYGKAPQTGTVDF